MIKSTVLDVQNFLENYHQFSRSLEAEKYDHYRQRFDGLISGYQTLSEALHAHDAHFTERYNLFSILNIKRRETATHTPFLKNLLDIHGEHAQGALFYQGFLDTVMQPANARKESFGRVSKHHFEVIEELPTVFGRIDLFIRHFSNDNPFCICIENKIYATDQPQQLERYQLAQGLPQLRWFNVSRLEPDISLSHIFTKKKRQYKETGKQVENWSACL